MLVFEVSVPSSKSVRAHTEYQFILISNIPYLASTYTRTYKRYSELLKLHQKIRWAFPTLPLFPKKTWLGRMRPTVIEERRKRFEEYFRYIFEFIVRNDFKDESFAQEIFDFFNK